MSKLKNIPNFKTEAEAVFPTVENAEAGKSFTV